MINEVLDLSKIEAGKMELYPQTFRVATIVEIPQLHHGIFDVGRKSDGLRIQEYIQSKSTFELILIAATMHLLDISRYVNPLQLSIC